MPKIQLNKKVKYKSFKGGSTMSTMNMKRFRAKIDIQHILMMMLIFMLSFSIVIPISTITVHAIIDIGGTSGGSQQATKGSGHPYYKRTGWLVYFCRESTGTLISPVIYINSTGYFDTRGLRLNVDYLLSRVGGQAPISIQILPNGCPWGTPWTDSGATRYKEVKKYFVQGNTIRSEAKQGLMACGVPADIIDKTLTDDDICLILENCAYYRLNGQYYLASSYGFGKLYKEQPNICNDTNGATEKFYGLGSVQKCEHFEKDHGNLPSHVTVTGSAC